MSRHSNAITSAKRSPLPSSTRGYERSQMEFGNEGEGSLLVIVAVPNPWKLAGG
jgi:hypothetical protein